MSKHTPTSPGSVVDLFCGAGGLSYGFFQEGFNIVAGVDLDQVCRYAFEKNNQSDFYEMDIQEVSGDWLNGLWARGPRILAGCAPCQPFSTYNQNNKDSQWKLLREFSRLVKETRPDVVTMENVPMLLKYKMGKIFEEFKSVLENCGYYVWHQVVRCAEYGVPQKRSRLVLLASRHGSIEMIPPKYKAGSFRTVKSAIGGLSSIKAGGADAKDPLHKSSKLSETNMRRIRQSKPGGSWRDWDKPLVSKCHTRATGRTYPSVYGRMRWNEPAPTITTQFLGFGNGRFGHPTQNRAISLREGALLQSFPKGYTFIEKGRPVRMRELGRMIGNAVPPRLARAIAQSINLHLQEHRA